MATNNAANLKNAGVQSLTTAGVFNGRTLTGTSNQISVSNGDGTAGNPTFSLTSTIYVSGISFDSGSFTLSTYTTGTYNPTIGNSGSAPTVGYSVQIGRYTQIGNRVITTIVIALSSYTAGTGNTQIKSLPFTSNSTTNNNCTSALGLQSTTFGASVVWYNVNLAPNVTVMDLPGNRSATTALNLVAAGPGASSQFRTSIAYEV